MKKYIYKSIGLLMAVATLTSCLKDDRLVLNPENSINVVDFVNPGEIAVHGSTTALYVLSYPIVTTATVIPIEVSYSGAADGAPNDIAVTLALAPQSVIDQYKTENGGTYEAMPSSMYSLSTTTLTIPKGQKRATMNVSVQTNLFDLEKAYVIPLQIVSATNATVSKNFSNILLNVGAKNQWDGRYSYKASANQTLLPNRSVNTTLVTTRATRVKITPGLAANYSNEVQYEIDPVTNKVTTLMIGSGALPPISTDPISAYNPTTKTFNLRWFSNGGVRLFEETLVYLGPRP